MLIGIDPRVSPELLHCLALMGHGDEIVIADRNFKAASTAAGCTVKQVIRYPGLDAVKVVDIISGLMPLDAFVDYAALRMEIDSAPDEENEVHKGVWNVLTPRLPDGAALGSIERLDFYDRSARAFAVVHTSETRPYGCFILRKGVIF